MTQEQKTILQAKAQARQWPDSMLKSICGKMINPVTHEIYPEYRDNIYLTEYMRRGNSIDDIVIERKNIEIQESEITIQLKDNK